MPDAKQFDGSIGCARDIAEWCGDGRAIWGGPHRLPPGDDDGSWSFDPSRPGGLNVLEQQETGLHHHDVPAGSWVVKDAEGDLIIYSDKQYQAAFGQK